MLVVGAGLAGLSAARALAAADRDVLVAEARDRVGGRALSAEIPGGEQVEMGGQWIGPGQNRAYALVRELGLRTFPTHTEGENLLEVGGRRTRYRGTIPKLSPLVLADIAQVRLRLALLARRVDPAHPWEAKAAAKLDAISLDAWLRRAAGSRTTRELTRIAGRTVWGAEPEDISMLHVLHYVAAAGSFDALLDTEGGAQQDRIVGGSQLLAIRIAEGLGDRVLTSSPVSRIERREDSVVALAGRHEIRARRAIVAIPPALQLSIDHDPPLPTERSRLCRRMTPGLLTKVNAIYEEPFWRAAGLSGETVTDAGPITLTFDNSPPSGRPGAIAGFAGGRDALEFARLEPGERREAVLSGLARLFGPDARDPVAYLERDWAAAQWSGGGPTSNFATGGWTSVGPSIREPVGPLHWAGTETATRWAGYFEGALQSGERAARELTRRGGL